MRPIVSYFVYSSIHISVRDQSTAISCSLCIIHTIPVQRHRAPVWKDETHGDIVIVGDASNMELESFVSRGRSYSYCCAREACHEQRDVELHGGVSDAGVRSGAVCGTGLVELSE